MVDTNVILDVWLAREPHWIESAQLVGQIEEGKLTGYLCPTTVTALHYLGKKVLGEKNARALLSELLDLFEVATLTPAIFRDALNSSIVDFEDAVIEAVSIATEVDLIATRNLKDFRKSRIEAKSPSQIPGVVTVAEPV
ncbi:MAG: PIN domain-containing protein [Opitutales bacterium]|nr:PIN domain-containing protein [Opitutales bacterium]